MINFEANDVILVTGASSGLGAESAVLLNKLGATVIGIGRNQERLLATKDKCASPQTFYPEIFDLSGRLDEIPQFIREIRNKYGKFRGLLACAGRGARLPVATQNNHDMEDIFKLNVFSLYQLSRAFLDRRNNQGYGSSAVFLASTSTSRDNAGLSAYASSKGAVVSMAKSLACEYLAQGIRINAISPGFILTPMTRAQYLNAEEIAKTYPLGLGSPQDVANLSAFLLSNASRWLTGQIITLDGGRGLL